MTPGVSHTRSQVTTQRIRRFDPMQAAKVMGVLYAILGLIFLPFFAVISYFSPQGSAYGLGLAIAFPVIYGVLGAIFMMIAAVLYNTVAGWVGGIEVELE